MNNLVTTDNARSRMIAMRGLYMLAMIRHRFIHKGKDL